MATLNHHRFKHHNPKPRGVVKSEKRLASLIGTKSIDQMREERLEEDRRMFWEEQQRSQQAASLRQLKEIKAMTVSLYKSVASGAREIVVQTNAQSLDVFVAGLSDALDAAIRSDPEQAAQTISATLKNAFPVAFAIAGYKAEKVSESKLLTCGFASPDSSELVAQSKV